MIYSDLVTVTGPEGRGERIRFVALTVFSTLLQAASVVTLVPVLHALFGDRPADAWPWVGLLVLQLLLAWIADRLAIRAGLKLGFRIIDTITETGLSGIRRLDPGSLHSERASKLRDLVSVSAPESISAVVLLGSPLIRAVLLTPLIALMLLFVSWKLALVALVGGIVMFLALLASQRVVTRSEAAFSETNRVLDNRVLEFAWAQPTLRGSGAGTGTVNDVLSETRNRGLKLLAWTVPGELMFSVVLQLTLLAFGLTTASLYLSGEISGVTAAAMIVVLLRIVEVVGSLSLLGPAVANASRVFGEVAGLVDEEKVAAAQATAAAEPVSGAPEIALRDVNFTYPDGTRALSGVDTVVPAGGITVIVGRSGSGKSTLLDVVAGLCEPTEGQVIVGDSPASAAERLAGASVVFQTTQLRPGTLRENVGTDDVTALATLADRAQLGEVLETLPSGWDSRVGEGGNALSGGERQRVGLARALAKPSGLLLVDEATSALDAITERAVVDALEETRGERTAVIVTHRPALVSLADRVIVLDDGKIVDSGKVDELLDRGGVFADLWTRWRESEGWQV
ncbi:putative iron-siderophore ABC transporter permease/ATP-binding protein [Gordonia araii NBRC 100433]|uniref:Putative iron-siderophore ABC transporter permease/ATP-binding protein n=1 Tax=Gordonia araii NBRC 100433 TaxID=1073574 RepID=G7H575_9ACTN|nr:ABC transporter ATP-binding protein [Gordonia araii]NNG95717.1 ABC transporter ATP-binding protein [Gordonia araii NBRC 100433]GAB11000.1 putative iron-siderophore ABC transporter permease/ATP-binding protein [Gordonia araii NBRC 100433]